LRSADRIAVTVREAGGGHLAEVTVHGQPTTTHLVRVSRAECERYGGGDVEFLLAREANTSILREFDLSEIERYFPEYAREFRRS